MNILLKYIFTMVHLKIGQVFYRCYYIIKRKLNLVSVAKVNHQSSLLIFRKFQPFFVDSGINEYSSELSSIIYSNRFRFLNVDEIFTDEVEWHRDSLNSGTRLWKLNLHYSGYLVDVARQFIETKNRADLLFIEKYFDSWIRNNSVRSEEAWRDCWNSYCVSLRALSWIKTLCLVSSFLDLRIIEKVKRSLQEHYHYLCNNLEYDLLGNHILQNAISLCVIEEHIIGNQRDSTRLLEKELREQVLRDGAHFELSPTYHSLLLWRLMDLYAFWSNGTGKKPIVRFVREVIIAMLTWLKNITFSNGDIPLVNDSAFGIAPTPLELVSYADKLGISSTRLMDDPENYRLIRKKSYELFIDINEIGPSYQPGHAHADTFNFIVYANNRPFIVDTGTSTYDSGSIRDYERSTAAHNTVEINGMNSSEVWSSFRVARRAHILELEEGEDFIRSMHDGYKRIGTYHKRAWTWDDSTICITDRIKGKFREGIAYFHLHPECEILNLADRSVITDLGTLSFTSNAIDISTFYYAPEFNIRIPSKVIEVSFTHDLKTDIVIS